MPSMPHEGPLDLVRQHPEIAVDLLKGTAGISLPGQVAVSLAPTDMSAVVPVQYLADMVVLISDATTGDPALAVIIEPQLRDSDTKRYSWPEASERCRTAPPGGDDDHERIREDLRRENPRPGHRRR